MDNQDDKKQDSLNCKNCGTDVSGTVFCPTCGQKSDTHVLTFTEFLLEMADGLFNFDSRLWRSLLPLILHPGKLTNEYLKGRRMRYLPPFRLYLILSLLFFVIPNYEGDIGNSFVDSITEDVANPPENDEPGEVFRPFDRSDEVDAESVEDLGQIVADEVRRELEEDEDINVFVDSDDDCSLDGWPAQAWLTPLVRMACIQIDDNPEQFFQEVIDSIPVMMILGIPLVAFFMQLVYFFLVPAAWFQP